MPEKQEHNADQFVAVLADKDAMNRQHGREALVNIGSAAVPSLMKALGDKRQHVRWEAAKTLAEISDPAAAKTLVQSIGDEDADVRWVAGEALIALKGDAVKPLLNGLTKSQDSEGLYKSAHHVMHALSQHSDLGLLLVPVLKALDHSEPEIAVPVAAQKVLEDLG
jgi:HEAT repeat protein